MRRHNVLLALNCIQTSTPKKVITEEDVIASNKTGFGSKIGSITNKITAITSLMSNYEQGSKEYETLRYRTQCGQALQQREIDKSKGILPIPMPKEWYDYAATRVKDVDSDEEKSRKLFNRTICAYKKPYFFAWNYDFERIKYNKFIEEANAKSISMFGYTLQEIQSGLIKNENAIKFAAYCASKCPLDLSPSTMNRICWKVENEFDDVSYVNDTEFDYSIYKSNCDIQRISFGEIKYLCQLYVSNLKELNSKKINNEDERKALLADKDSLLEILKEDITIICPDEDVLCDILLDICYEGQLSKSIVWDICGDKIIENMLKKHNFILTYPEKSENGDFYCCGVNFLVKTIKIGGENNDEV